MKDQDNRIGQQKPGGGGDRLQELFHYAGAREKPSARLEQAARDTLRAEWRQITTRRKRRRLLAGLAVAATVVLAAGAVLRLTGGPAPPGPVIQLAVVENQLGTAQVHEKEPAAKSELLRTDSRLVSGQVVETGPGSATALRWFHGQSVRLDENTRIRLDSAGDIRLDRGRIYVDTANRPAGVEALTIITPAGRLRHVGTQYMTAVSPAGTTVSVRSGKIALDLSGTEHLVARGEQMRVSGDGKRSVRQIDTWGESWRWTERITPAFDSDGKNIAELIGWVAGETGHLVEFTTVEAENQARQTILRGRLELEPMKALSTITQTSGMEARVADGRIVVSLARE
jgi:hypothetical protein